MDDGAALGRYACDRRVCRKTPRFVDADGEYGPRLWQTRERDIERRYANGRSMIAGWSCGTQNLLGDARTRRKDERSSGHLRAIGERDAGGVSISGVHRG